jgi:DNA-binding HxlR family transcriptional regulator
MARRGQFCPVARAADVFAERWTPLILREFLHGSHRFSDLQRGLPLISRSLLAQRLRSLERQGVLERRSPPNGRGWEYALTPAGEELRQAVEALGAWGYRWAMARLSEDDLDPDSLMWFIHRHIHVDRLPAGRIVARFAFRGERKKLWWLILQRPDVDLCLKDEGFEVDLYVTADLMALTRVYLGHLPLPDAVRQGLVEIEGSRDLVRDFTGWLGVSKFARFGQPAIESVQAVESVQA